VTVGHYADGRPGEVFLKVAKQGSTLAGIMDALSISLSYGLQYGVPLRAFVEAFSNTRFEPAGMTDDPELRIASSLLDYIFRRLAVDYLTKEERDELGHGGHGHAQGGDRADDRADDYADEDVLKFHPLIEQRRHDGDEHAAGRDQIGRAHV